MRKQVLIIRHIHSSNEGSVFVTVKAIEDISIHDLLFINAFEKADISAIRLKSIEMYREKVDFVPQAYGADITMMIPGEVNLREGQVLYR